MTEYCGPLETGRGEQEVFDYISFRSAADWDFDTVSISQTAGTGAGLGSRYRLAPPFIGRPITLDDETISNQPMDKLVLGFEGGSQGHRHHRIRSERRQGAPRYNFDFQFNGGLPESMAVLLSLAADRSLVVWPAHWKADSAV